MAGLTRTDFDRFEALTFDCYGTLIDWESGILDAVRVLLDAHGVAGHGDEELLARYAQLESTAEQGPFRAYRSVLADVARGFAADFGFVPSVEDVECFASSVGAWPPFPDTIAALNALAGRYRLAIVSNVDDDLFDGSREQLGIDFAHIVTAQQILSYKPAPEHFHEVLRRLALPKSHVLHVAQSLYHDIAPARELGISCVWVNRREGKAGGGATKASDARPDHVVPSLAALVSDMGLSGS